MASRKDVIKYVARKGSRNNKRQKTDYATRNELGKRPSGYKDNNPKTALGLKKVSLSKVPPSALIYEALALMDGATKYGPYNWRKNAVTASIYIDACKRHLDSWWDGEDLAGDSQVSHLGHARASIAILIDAIETGNVIDDRPRHGTAAKLIARYTKKAKNK